MFRLAYILLISTSAVSFAAPSSAAPQRPEVGQDAVVYGRAQHDPAQRVGYADLDLTRKEGERQLVRRVRNAVDRACHYESALEARNCRTQVWAHVRPKIRQAVHNARNTEGFVTQVSMFIHVPQEN
jgi:UrcA family protein